MSMQRTESAAVSVKYIGVTFGGYNGIMENRMETTIMENQMENKLENEMETGGI